MSWVDTTKMLMSSAASVTLNSAITPKASNGRGPSTRRPRQPFSLMMSGGDRYLRAHDGELVDGSGDGDEGSGHPRRERVSGIETADSEALVENSEVHCSRGYPFVGAVADVPGPRTAPDTLMG